MAREKIFTSSLNCDRAHVKGIGEGKQKSSSFWFSAVDSTLLYVAAVSGDKYPSLLNEEMYIMTQKQVCNRWIDCTMLRDTDEWKGDKLQFSTRLVLPAKVPRSKGVGTLVELTIVPVPVRN
jgi:hypothetical protein